MKTHRLLALLLVGIVCFMASVREARAVILVYRVTASVRALNFPTTSSVVYGWLLFDTNDSSQSQTVEIFKNKTYTQNGLLFTLLTPTAFTLTAFDSNHDTFPDLIAPLIGLQTQTFTDARAYRGAVSKLGFRIGTNPAPFMNVARVLHGYGTRVVTNSDLLFRTDTMTIDVLTGALPANTTVARDNVIGRLANGGYHAAGP